jgi:hypothetical protein
MTLNRAVVPLLAIAGAGTLACNNSSAPRASHPVAFHLAASATPASGSVASAVTVTSLRLVVGPAALGSGDQFGCVNCEGNDTESETPELISVPPDGSPVLVRTEQVSAGHYDAAEIELQNPDAGIIGAAPGWPSNATIEVAGSSNGAAFTLPLSVVGEFRVAVNPPVDVTEGAPPTTASVTITLPISSWFESNGVALDPNDPAQRAQIEANARLSVRPEDENGGRED